MDGVEPRAERALVSSAEAYRLVEEARQMRAEREDARRWAVRLEGELAAAQAAVRAEFTRAVEAIEQRDEVVTALADLLDDVIEDLEMLSMPARKARQVVERYRRGAPASGPT